MMATSKLTVNIHVPWWVIWYVRCVGLFAQMTGMEPDYPRVGRFVLNRMRIRTNG